MARGSPLISRILSATGVGASSRAHLQTLARVADREAPSSAPFRLWKTLTSSPRDRARRFRSSCRASAHRERGARSPSDRPRERDWNRVQNKPRARARAHPARSLGGASPRIARRSSRCVDRELRVGLRSGERARGPDAAVRPEVRHRRRVAIATCEIDARRRGKQRAF